MFKINFKWSILKALFKQKQTLCVLHLDYPYNWSQALGYVFQWQTGISGERERERENQDSLVLRMVEV